MAPTVPEEAGAAVKVWRSWSSSSRAFVYLWRSGCTWSSRSQWTGLNSNLEVGILHQLCCDWCLHSKSAFFYTIFLKNPLTRKYRNVKLEYIFKSACWLHNSPRQLKTSFCYYKCVHRVLQTLSPLLTANETLSFSFWLFLQPSKYFGFLMHSNVAERLWFCCDGFQPHFAGKWGKYRAHDDTAPAQVTRSFPLICITVR